MILLDTSGLLAALDSTQRHHAEAAAVERNAYLLEAMDAKDVAEAHETINRHCDLGISLADASIVVLANRHETRDVLTLDERHFRVLRTAAGPFRLLPADA